MTYIRSKDMRYSCASLRADSLTQAVVDGLADSGQKTITIAPETGSERLRRVINKGISEEHLRNAATLSAKSGIQHMRLYIMIGLPTETDEDIDAIISLAERTQAHMAEVGCKGRLTLSINPFIPKPFTPFQWMAMAHQKDVERKLQYIKKSLQKNRRIEVLVESPKEAYIQGVLARGDRRLGAVIAACAADRGSKSFKAEMRAAGLDMDDMNYRERSFDECLPWSHLDMGLRDGYLEMEWKRSLDEAYTPPCADGCKRCGVCE
nr:radical SAM protein [Veillonella denticariosi]